MGVTVVANQVIVPIRTTLRSSRQVYIQLWLQMTFSLWLGSGIEFFLLKWFWYFFLLKYTHKQFVNTEVDTEFYSILAYCITIAFLLHRVHIKLLTQPLLGPSSIWWWKTLQTSANLLRGPWGGQVHHFNLTTRNRTHVSLASLSSLTPGFTPSLTQVTPVQLLMPTSTSGLTHPILTQVTLLMKSISCQFRLRLFYAFFCHLKIIRLVFTSFMTIQV